MIDLALEKPVGCVKAPLRTSSDTRNPIESL
jgi:hypothetical protein